jgi:hypothetical protein
MMRPTNLAAAIAGFGFYYAVLRENLASNAFQSLNCNIDEWRIPELMRAVALGTASPIALRIGSGSFRPPRPLAGRC